jgi:uncharacterized membrane protein YphA (DoxX/SURF4 family)
LAWVGGIVLGVVLVTAAWSKALDPRTFAEQISYEGLDFLVPAAVLAWLVILVEVVFGIALLLGLRTRQVLLPTGLLIAVFVFLTSRAYWRWAHGIEVEGPDCGCFGNLIARSPAEAFWQDLVLLLPPYVLALLDQIKARDARILGRWGLVVAAGLIAGVFTLFAPGLPIDDLATRLSPGVAVSQLCAGSSDDAGERICLDLLVPELESGRHLVIIESLESPILLSAVDDLNALATSNGESVWVVADATEDDLQVFYWEWGPLFEIREAPAALLRPLYRTLPRSFLVVDGLVVETWAGMPEFERAGDAL